MSTEIKLKKEWLSKDEKLIIKGQFFPPKTTDLEMQYCMKVAESLGLNPILKQIFFVPRRSKVGDKWVDKIEPLAGRDSFLHLAHKTKKFESITSFTNIIEKPTLINGEWELKKDMAATAIVKRTDKDSDSDATVYYSEYVQLKKDGTPTKFWQEKPITMLKKVAESQALRKAFNITGLYDESELSTEIKDVALEKSKQTIEIKANKPEPIETQTELTEAEITEAIQEQDKEAANKNKPGFE